MTAESAAATLDVQGASLGWHDFDRIAAFIHGTVGIKLPRSKHALVEGRLRRRLAATGAADFAAYCASVLDGGEGGGELPHLIDALTTNKTDFFREPEHFRILTEHALPELWQPGRPLKLWSAACSTGAEPYTLAMVVDDFLRTRRPAPPPSILATDISIQVLQAARLGVFPAEMANPVPPAFRSRYLLRSRDRERQQVRVVPALRTLVHFRRLNLMDAEYPFDRDMDAVFCRNVLIYFDRETQAGVLQRLCRHLRPGGVLVLGHSETLSGFDLPVAAIGHTIFRRS